MKSQTITCNYCKKEHLVKNIYSSRCLYCSIQCQQDSRLDESVKNGNASTKSLKRFLIREHGEKCWTCGIENWNNKKIVFELEHKDGNSENNLLDNLSILCPNCHSQTPTYKGRNKGKGRYSRRVRYSEGKSF